MASETFDRVVLLKALNAAADGDVVSRGAVEEALTEVARKTGREVAIRWVRSNGFMGSTDYTAAIHGGSLFIFPLIGIVDVVRILAPDSADTIEMPTMPMESFDLLGPPRLNVPIEQWPSPEPSAEAMTAEIAEAHQLIVDSLALAHELGTTDDDDAEPSASPSIPSTVEDAA